MTIEQALKLLSEVTAQVSANRIVHQQILQALDIIRKALLEKEESEDKN